MRPRKPQRLVKFFPGTPRLSLHPRGAQNQPRCRCPASRADAARTNGSGSNRGFRGAKSARRAVRGRAGRCSVGAGAKRSAPAHAPRPVNPLRHKSARPPLRPRPAPPALNGEVGGLGGAKRGVQRGALPARALDAVPQTERYALHAGGSGRAGWLRSARAP